MVIEYEAGTKGVGAASWGSGVLWAIQFDDVYDWFDPSAVMDYQVWSWRDLDPSEGWPDLVFAFDNVSPGWVPLGSIGLENEEGTLGTSFTYLDYIPASGDVICFDYAETNAEPVVITFEAVVETTEEKDVENIVEHLADGLGMKLEEASASFHNTPNLQPIADPQSLTTAEETPLDITLTGSLLNPGPVTWDAVSGPSHGTLSGSGTDWVYTPNDDFYGTDQFDFIVNDGLEDSDPATVVIEVTNINDEPVAVDDEYWTPFETVLDIPAPGVMENDFDADPTDNVFVEVDVEPENGDLVLNLDGSFTYTPHASFFGIDSFTYFLNGLTGRAAYTDYATVTITVDPFMRIYMPLFNN